MQFQVPQFIDVSPKIVGPLTLKQFGFLSAAGIPILMLYFALPFALWLIVSVLLITIGAAFAFGKINGRPLITVAMAAFSYFWQPRFYLWKRVEQGREIPQPKPEKPIRAYAPLKDLLFKIATTTKPIKQREKPAKLFTEKPERILYETIRRTTGEREQIKRVDY